MNRDSRTSGARTSGARTSRARTSGARTSGSSIPRARATSRGAPRAVRCSLAALLAASLLGLAGAAAADVLIFYPNADAYVEDTYPTTNFGGDGNLYVGDENYNEPVATCRSYLRFELATLPPGAEVQSAVLKLRSWGVGPEPDIVVGSHYLGNDGWSESAITWSNAPVTFNATPSDLVTVDSSAMWFLWDVTSDVQTAAGGDRVYSVVMKATSEGSEHSWCGFHSRETAGTVDDPYLEVDYTVAPTIDFESWQNLTGVFESDAAWGDFDGDGDLDLVICGQADAGLVTETYENQGGTLVLRQSLAGIHTTGSGCLAWGDYDGDGDLDLAMAGMGDSGRIARIYRNDGSGNLSHDAAQVLQAVDAAALAWGDVDLDGDLDLVLMGSDGAVRLTVLYRNDPLGTLTPDTVNHLTGLASGSADWADYDGDGDPDLLITGSDGSSGRAIFYRNEPTGTLTDDGDHGLPGSALSDVAFGDYDADGDLDLAYTGEAGAAGRIARIYENTDGAGTFTEVVQPLDIYRSSCAWGDYDNDGDLDVAFCGYTGTGLRTCIYENTGTGFTDGGFSLVTSREGSVSWADVDGDRDLDFLVTGADWSYKYARLYRNTGADANTAPTAPAVLTGQQYQLVGGLHLSWSGASDAETPVAGLYYCLRVGSAPGANDIVSGTYATPLMGNVGQTTDVVLDLPPATYYWSVRTIDSGFLASAWAPEQVCEEPPNIQTVTIDPSEDAFVNNMNPMHCYGADPTYMQYLDVGNFTSTPGDMTRAYLLFNVNAVPADSIVRAELHAYRFGGSGSPYYVEVIRENIDNWDESTICWSNAPTMFSPQASAVARVDGQSWCAWDVTADVICEAQVDGRLTEVLRGNAPPEGAPGVIAEFWSDEAAQSSVRPYLKIWYRSGTTAIEPAAGPAAGVTAAVRLLEPNTPNPFNPSTTIGYSVRDAGPVMLAIYAVDGRRVRTLVDAPHAAGRFRIDWDGRDDAGLRAASGAYFYRLVTRDATETRKMTLLK